MRKLLQRYKENPFFRSTLHVIALQMLFIALICVIFYLAIQHQQTKTVETLREHVVQVRAGMEPEPGVLSNSFAGIRYETATVVFIILVVLTIVFGYLTARYALSPTRDTHKTQRRFIGNLAHELRTPLSVMRTDTEVSLMDPGLHPQVRSMLESNLEEIGRISEIINNVLTFNSLLRPGQVSLEALDLVPVLQVLVARHDELAERRGITLTLDTPEHARTYGNAVALEQVFTNLVKNALNYTPQHEGREVTVHTTLSAHQVCVVVADTGIGIAERDLYHIFEPFYRGDTSRSRNIGGGTSGLGLAIVNDIIRAHSGTITIRSALNRGTSIEIALPAADPSSSPSAPPEEDEQEHEARIVSR